MQKSDHDQDKALLMNKNEIKKITKKISIRIYLRKTKSQTKKKNTSKTTKKFDPTMILRKNKTMS